ncbi:S8 family peptidase [Microbacterium sp. B2969]|uniref:S8 family peptidase n=1 Tax=Microbacterium alkaliflavum TaxID=3248839 RepID=A0ABW7Q2M5_9MICO
MLDPAGEPPNSVFPTIYVTDELLIDRNFIDEAAFAQLTTWAARAGWTLEIVRPAPTIEVAASEQSGLTASRPPVRSRGASMTVRARLRLAHDGERVVADPDAWALVREVRRTDWGRRGIGLNHVLSTDSLGLNPFTANPFTANPFTANPFTANPFTANPIASYAQPGFGGLQPVAYLGQEPIPGNPKVVPIVAIFDTGWGDHPWLKDCIIQPFLAGGNPIGIDPDSDTDPESEPSLAEPLEGIFDHAAGHGTFIAGIVRQECPDAMILPVRIADGEGLILEDDLLGALGRLVEFMDDTTLEQKRKGSKVSVLNLSFSYYHETPDDPDTVSEMASLLDKIRDRGCVVVCSAGNDATDRPTFPAAIPALDPNRHVSVGALNPSDRSVALFSNIGDWVEVYAPGVSVLSTLPVTFEGGLQSGTRDDEEGRRRETLDPDDYQGGFGVWSGTSFAAPVVAGRIAAQIASGEAPETAKDVVAKRLTAQDQSRMR